jgi:hypothetical protein
MQIVTEFFKSTLNPGGMDRTLKDELSIAKNPTGHIEIIRVYLGGCNQYRSQCTTTHKDLRLRKVKRILPLNVPGRDIVGDGIP